MMGGLSFSIASLRTGFAQGLRAEDVAREALRRIAAYADPAVWITRIEADMVLAQAAALDALPPETRAQLPLFGVPFAIKDNIDLAGIPTSAACPAFSYTPARSAHVVQRLLEAGAIPMGKTNLDQFATGLVGTRSPHGAPRSVFNKDYISGGSSSGSAVAVAAGLVSFALGTDTAGSGRVPAAFNNIVGLKPSRGLLSTRGVVPACRSLDCVSIFALDAEDAETVFRCAMSYDEADAFSRPAPATVPQSPVGSFTFALPRSEDWFFAGDAKAESLFMESVRRLERMGGKARPIDITPFLDAAKLLYQGPWVAERFAAVGDFIAEHPEETDATVRDIILGGADRSAAEYFTASYKLAELKREADRILAEMDVLLVPTAPTTYRVSDIEADPLALNSVLGTYTNFMNLLDLCGIAIPAGLGGNGLPFGITLVAPAFHEAKLFKIGARFSQALALTPGAPWLTQKPFMEIAVVGAHMSGLPLNHELASRGAIFREKTRTAPVYRFHALAGGPPKRPGLVRAENGVGIELEIWDLPASQWGSFVAGVPQPLCIGTVELEDGRKVKGFLCEQSGLEGAEDISSFGGWRAFLASR